ncbi:hypothetical protein MCEMSEM47_02034 [Burkholderiales bacterium]|jgi:hypothetical protein
MLGKILIVLLAVGLALLALRSALGKSKKPPEADKPVAKDADRPSRLYPCARCGAMTPQEDVIWLEGKPFCSRSHAQP